MIFIDLLQETQAAITMNKVRSGLTILGIVIGIGSVVAMVSIGQGAAKSIQSNIESMGSNLLTVMPGAQRNIGTQIRSAGGSAQSLTQEDAEAIIEEVSLIKAIAPYVSKSYQITAKGTNTNTRILGTNEAYADIKSIEMESGVFISQQQNENYSKVAVLGSTVRDDLFGEETDPTGEKIRINGIIFTIIGVTKSKGGTGFNSEDDMVYVPLYTAQRFLTGNKYLSSIYVQAQDQESMTLVEEEITNLLLVRHDITDSASADFSIMNQADLAETASSSASTFTMLLGAIAGISLIVGGIGIMNMMLTTVTERTREIGLRKAIGAKNRDISLQFLAEAITLTLIGGVIGTALGWVISILMTKFGDITTSVSTASVLLAFGVSAAIGIGFGYYPARRAASLNPIEALRYE